MCRYLDWPQLLKSDPNVDSEDLKFDSQGLPQHLWKINNVLGPQRCMETYVYTENTRLMVNVLMAHFTLLVGLKVYLC